MILYSGFFSLPFPFSRATIRTDTISCGKICPTRPARCCNIGRGIFCAHLVSAAHSASHSCLQGQAEQLHSRGGLFSHSASVRPRNSFSISPILMVILLSNVSSFHRASKARPPCSRKARRPPASGLHADAAARSPTYRPLRRRPLVFDHLLDAQTGSQSSTAKTHSFTSISLCNHN